jgi:hypothetical protein
LARQIERLLSDVRMRERTIAQGRERIRAQHAPVAAADRVIALYDMVAKHASGA